MAHHSGFELLSQLLLFLSNSTGLPTAIEHSWLRDLTGD